MAAQIFGIDHGNGAVKGGNVNIPCGLVSYVSEPGRFMNEDILEYDGRYFTLSDKRMPFKEDKTSDEDYFILTLFALAMEARAEGTSLNGKEVVLGVGLPPADFGQQSVKFRNYFTEHSRHGVKFRLNRKPINFNIKNVYVSPQKHVSMRVVSSSFVERILAVNGYRDNRTYQITGTYFEKNNAVVFNLADMRLFGEE